jgi:starvation-inducible DNA-binding protein
MDPNLGLPREVPARSAEMLHALLADEFVLYTKTRNYHWNVVGGDFSQLHRLLEKQYESLGEIVDEVAERARAIGVRALGSLREFLEHTRLQESSGRPSAREMLFNLLQDHEAIVRHLRDDLRSAGADFEDLATVDYLTALIGRHEKTAWMLRSHLEEK